MWQQNMESIEYNENKNKRMYLGPAETSDGKVQKYVACTWIEKPCEVKGYVWVVKSW